MVYIRGNRANYDAWGDGSRYSDVLPYFKKSEDNARGESEYHGAGGPLPVTDTAVTGFGDAFAAATAADCKGPVLGEFTRPSQEGAGHYQVTIANGRRASTAVTFLEAARARDNLTVISGALAVGLVVDGTRVTGVRVRIGGKEEVIAGAET